MQSYNTTTYGMILAFKKEEAKNRYYIDWKEMQTPETVAFIIREQLKRRHLENKCLSLELESQNLRMVWNRP